MYVLFTFGAVLADPSTVGALPAGLHWLDDSLALGANGNQSMHPCSTIASLILRLRNAI